MNKTALLSLLVLSVSGCVASPEVLAYGVATIAPGEVAPVADLVGPGVIIDDYCDDAAVSLSSYPDTALAFGVVASNMIAAVSATASLAATNGEYTCTLSLPAGDTLFSVVVSTE